MHQNAPIRAFKFQQISQMIPQTLYVRVDPLRTRSCSTAGLYTGAGAYRQELMNRVFLLSPFFHVSPLPFSLPPLTYAFPLPSSPLSSP